MGVLPSLTEGLATKDGILYAGTGKYLQAIDASTGEMLWQNRDWGQNQGSTATLSVSDEVIIGSTQWGALYGNDVKQENVMEQIAGWSWIQSLISSNKGRTPLSDIR